MGRSNVKTVAERRLPEIQKFLQSLFMSADEIAHSNLVYTFFHPLLRDQQEANLGISKVKGENIQITNHFIFLSNYDILLSRNTSCSIAPT